jgi:hypothetical protein
MKDNVERFLLLANKAESFVDDMTSRQLSSISRAFILETFYHDILGNMQIDAMKRNHIISDMQSQNKSLDVSKEILASLWNIPSKEAAQTLRVTT